MEYDLVVKPTVYGSVSFRSRTEARWAAFFDVIGYTWRYEPRLLQGWLPDFELELRNGGTVYCEVKPVECFLNLPEIRKIYAKAIRGSIRTILLGQWPIAVDADGSFSPDHGAHKALGLSASDGVLKPLIVAYDENGNPAGSLASPGSPKILAPAEDVQRMWNMACRNVKRATRKQSKIKRATREHI